VAAVGSWGRSGVEIQEGRTAGPGGVKVLAKVMTFGAKPKGGNEAVTSSKEAKMWRNEQSIEKDDRSSWCCKKVVSLKSDFPQYLKYEILFCPVLARFFFR
jgi:hypothetical protein